MSSIETTSLSSRGQIVIPQGIRDKLRLEAGEKFLVFGENNTIILQKIELPSFKGFDDLLKKTRDFVKKQGIKSKDVKGAVELARSSGY